MLTLPENYATIQRCEIPHGWISLYDVIRRTGTYFLDVYRLLVTFEQLVALAPAPKSGSEKGIPLGTLYPTRSLAQLLAGHLGEEPAVSAEKINSRIALIEHDANELGLEGTADRIRAIREYVAEHTMSIDFQGDEHLRHDVRVLREVLESELEKRWIFIPDRETYRKYFDKSFGDEVDNAFPDARRDTASAANSYIYDEPTACVFHCMRTAEYGLRALTLHFDPTAKPNKLEWGPLIRNLEKRIAELHERNQQPDPDRQATLDFYSEALAQCRFFKRWRDDVSHTNGYYEATEALRALTHVEEFMKLLAKNGIALAATIP